MDIFDKLEIIYYEIDKDYKEKELQARSEKQLVLEPDYDTKRYYNNQAYFLFMFTRLEDRIRTLSDQLIDGKVTTTTDWESKRAWEIINKQKSKDRLDFMDRVALLTQKGYRDYNVIYDYYTERNEIAHGGSFTKQVILPAVIADMKRLNKDLKG